MITVTIAGVVLSGYCAINLWALKSETKHGSQDSTSCNRRPLCLSLTNLPPEMSLTIRPGSLTVSDGACSNVGLYRIGGSFQAEMFGNRAVSRATLILGHGVVFHYGALRLWLQLCSRGTR